MGVRGQQPQVIRMDSIKKKMEKLSNETADAESRIAHFEEIKAQNEAEADKFEEQVRNIQKKMQAMESAFDVCTEDLFNQTVKLEEMEKKAGNAEGDVSSLRSRLILLQENNEKQEDRLAKATLELAGACMRADQRVRKRIELENGVSSNEETIDNLDKPGRLEDHLERLREQVRRHQQEAGNLGSGCATRQRARQGSREEDHRHRGGTQGGRSQHAAAGDRGREDNCQRGGVSERDSGADVQVEEERVQRRAG